jgi:hypothetical protein
MKSIALLLAIAPLAIAACTPRAFAPPARPMPLGSARTPAVGEGDVQLDGNASGEVFGPGIVAGNARYRHGVADNVAVTADAGFVRVSGDSTENPWAGLGRAGVQVASEANEDLDVAVFAGIGGGYAPAAATWASTDVGVMMSGDNKHVRPIFLVDAYFAQPFATKVFVVEDEMLRMPRTAGVQGLFGFEFGPKDRAVLVGFALAKLWSAANDVQEADSATFVGLGGGMRFESLQ